MAISLGTNDLVVTRVHCILVILFYFLNQIFSLFPTVKMHANYAEICRVGNLEADFQQVLLVQFFWNFHNIVVKPIIQVQQRKVKNIFLEKNSKKITLL